MSLSDDILNLDDERIQCPDGHRVHALKTKDLDGGMDTYLLLNGALILVVSSTRYDCDDSDHPALQWRVENGVAIHEERSAIGTLTGPSALRAYARCARCAPLLVRTNAGFLGDLVCEHHLSVDFELNLAPGQPLQITRTSGTRDEFRRELLERGLHVLPDDDPLAIAHREAKQAQARLAAFEHRRARGRERRLRY